MIKTSALPLGRISLLLAIVVWLALVLVDLVRIFGMINNLDSGVSEEVTWILEILFFIFVYLVYRRIFWKNKQSDFLTLIWRGVSTTHRTAGTEECRRRVFQTADPVGGEGNPATEDRSVFTL